MATIRNLTAADLDAVSFLNEAAVPHVNSLSLDALRALIAMAACARVSIGGTDAPVPGINGRVTGVLVAFRPGATYGSDNYRWFSARFDEFVYVDRVMVDEGARGGGIASALYDDVELFARSVGAPRIVCEVNIRPANEASLRFHERRGFAEVGRQETEGGAKQVSLLEKRLDP